MFCLYFVWGQILKVRQETEKKWALNCRSSCNHEFINIIDAWAELLNRQSQFYNTEIHWTGSCFYPTFRIFGPTRKQGQLEQLPLSRSIEEALYKFLEQMNIHRRLALCFNCILYFKFQSHLEIMHCRTLLKTVGATSSNHHFVSFRCQTHRPKVFWRSLCGIKAGYAGLPYNWRRLVVQIHMRIFR